MKKSMIFFLYSISNLKLKLVLFNKPNKSLSKHYLLPKLQPNIQICNLSFAYYCNLKVNFQFVTFFLGKI